MNRNCQVLSDTLQKNKIAIILFAVMTVLNAAVFFLYNILTEGFVYSEVLLIVLLLFLLGIDFLLENKKAKAREKMLCNILISEVSVQSGGSLADCDYTSMIAQLQEEIQRLQASFYEGKQADDDYYTAWVHQIKTPIAVMKLQLTEDNEKNRALLSELFRIEQYVGMVLDYVRLRSDSNDLLIQEYSLDPIIREILRKYAPQFILRKLKLNYSPTETRVITDKKWLSFILEQLLSNAIKYTPCGEITISNEGTRISVKDTGIGIAPEDLPRIFEKGYTGMNGRLGEKSSGLGLFLCKKAANLLNAKICCESTVGKGSIFSVQLPEKETQI